MALEHRVEEIRLKNGAKGLFIYVPNTTVVEYNVVFRAGTLHAPKRISQVAHVMEHMAFGANAKYKSVEEFSRVFAKNGAYNNASTSSVSMSYVAYAGIAEWRRILELEGLSISQPRYTKKGLETEKRNVREELSGYIGNNYRALPQAIYKAAGVKWWNDQNEIQTIDGIGLEDIKAFQQHTHSFKNMRFLIAGDLEKHKDGIIKMIEGWSLPSGKRLPAPKNKFHDSTPVTLVRPNLASLSFRLQFSLNRALSLQEMSVITTLCHILTGTHHARILGKARSNGTCYAMRSYVYNSHTCRSSEWVFESDVREENAKPLFELIASELRKVASSGVAKTELSEATGYRLGKFQMAGQTVGDLAGLYGGPYFDSGIINHVATGPDRIKNVTSGDISKLAKEFITKGSLNFGVLAKSESELTNELYGIIDNLRKDLA